MDGDRLFELQRVLIDHLHGKLGVLQKNNEKVALVEQALEDIFAANSAFDKEKKALQNVDQRVKFINEFLSFDLIQDLLCDFNVEDIMINSLKTIYIHHAHKGLVATGKNFESQRELNLFIDKLVLFSGRTQRKRLMNLELPNLEGRVNIAFSTFGPQITITKAKLSPLSIIDLIEAGTLNYEVAAQLWLYMEGLRIRPANIIIAGGPGVGKTTLLNSLFSFIPESDRLVIIEDTLELNSFLEESCSRLESDEELSLADLVKNSLRMRPERIIVGEVRGEEARDMMTAANVGKYCMGTIHALTSREAIIRLQNEPMNIPEELINLIDVFIVLKRYDMGNRIFRVIDEISETSGMELVKILLSQVYKYDPDTKKIKAISPSTVYRDKLALQAGLQPVDVLNEVRVRGFILEQLNKQGLKTIKEITAFCRSYSKNNDTALKSLGFNKEKLIKDAR